MRNNIPRFSLIFPLMAAMLFAFGCAQGGSDSAATGGSPSGRASVGFVVGGEDVQAAPTVGCGGDLTFLVEYEGETLTDFSCEITDAAENVVADGSAGIVTCTGGSGTYIAPTNTSPTNTLLDVGPSIKIKVSVDTTISSSLDVTLSCIEVCDDGIDNDSDGYADCNDPDCGESPLCQGIGGYGVACENDAGCGDALDCLYDKNESSVQFCLVDNEAPTRCDISVNSTGSNIINFTPFCSADDISPSSRITHEYCVAAQGSACGGSWELMYSYDTYPRVDGLASGTSYTIYIRAKDEFGNISANYQTINASTNMGGEGDACTYRSEDECQGALKCLVDKNQGNNSYCMNDGTAPIRNDMTVHSVGSDVLYFVAFNTTDNISPYYTITHEVCIVARGLPCNDVWTSITSLNGFPRILEGLSASTSYTIYVRARDQAGNISDSQTVNVDTTDGGDGSACQDNDSCVGSLCLYDKTKNEVQTCRNDSTEPTMGAIAVHSIGSTIVNFTAYVSTDDVSPSWNISHEYCVAAQGVACGGTWVSMVSYDTYPRATGLTAGTAYTIYIRAKDQAGNISLDNAEVDVTTSP